MSLAEWAELPEDVPGELVSGHLVDEEMPDYAHEVLVAFLARVLGNWGDERGAIVAGSDARFAVSSSRGRKPDLTVFFAGRRPPRRGLVRIAPDIAVEIISSDARDARRDRVDKLAEYAAFGIAWYWLVDPQQRTLQVYARSAEGHYDLQLEQSSGVAVIPGCDGLRLDLNAMWRRIDELTD
jgi:Uma2 family endonuclease